jgi:hypothetical protein
MRCSTRVETAKTASMSTMALLVMAMTRMSWSVKSIGVHHGNGLQCSRTAVKGFQRQPCKPPARGLGWTGLASFRNSRELGVVP